MTAINLSLLRLLTLSLFTTLAGAECLSPSPKRLIIGIDLSASIKADQRERWIPIAQQFLRCIDSGDRMEIFAVHENTRDSAPLFAETFPTKRGATIDAMRKFALERKAFRQKAEAALDAAFRSDIQAKVTDLFSLLDRIRQENRTTFLVIFSDGYHSGPELNLEQVRLKQERFPNFIDTVSRAHNWNKHLLERTNVNFILPSVNCCGVAKPVNDRLVLGQFYNSLIRALGGQLQVFDTHVEVN